MRIKILCLLILFATPSFSYGGMLIQKFSADITYDYFMRSDGTAANVAAATGPITDASACMNEAVFNAGSFSPGDNILVSGRGGAYSTALAVPSSGTSGNQISLIGELGNEPYLSASTTQLDLNEQSYITITNFNSTSSATIGIYIDGASTGIITNNFYADWSGAGNQILQHYNTASVTHNNLDINNGGDECISTHNTPTVVINNSVISNSYGSCINFIDAPIVTLNDTSLTVGSGYQTILVDGGGTWSFNRCVFNDDPSGSTRVMDWDISGTTVEYINCIFKGLSSADYYILARSAVTSADFINCTFFGDGTASTTCIFNQSTGTKVKNCIFDTVGTNGLWGTTGTIDYNCFYSAGTVRGTNTVTSDPVLDATGRLTASSTAVDNEGIGPGSDSDIPTDDIDGDTRSGAAASMGADEY